MELTNKLILSADILSWDKVEKEHGSLLEQNLSDEKKSLYNSIFQRDNYTCYYCGFQSDRYQEVHHLDHNHENNDPSNLVTVCPLCHQNHHLNLADLHKGATLIWCPNLTQQEINDFCRLLFILEHMNTTHDNKHYIVKRAFTSFYEEYFKKGEAKLEEYFRGASNCGLMGQILLDKKKNNPNEYAMRESWLGNIKMLHTRSRFYIQSIYWSKLLNNNPNFRVDKWLGFAKKEAVEQQDYYKPATAEEVKEIFELDLSQLED